MTLNFIHRATLCLLCAAWIAACPAAAVGDSSRLLGIGLHQDTGRNIYLGGLYLDSAQTRPENLAQLSGPWRMEYRIVARRTSIRSLLGGMLLQSEVATEQPPGQVMADFADAILSAVQTSLYAGDVLVIHLDGRHNTVASLNGQQLAITANGEVANYLLAGWLGLKGPTSLFRESLVTPQSNPAQLAEFRSTTFTTEREVQVAAWFNPADTEPQLASVDSTEPPSPTASVPTASTPTIPTPKTPAPTTPAADPEPKTTLGTSVPGQDAIQFASLTTPAEVLQKIIPQKSVMSMHLQEYAQRLSDFHGQLVSMVYGQIKYPTRAVRRNLQGRLELDITLRENGELVAITVSQSSGHKLLDSAAVMAAEGALGSGALTSIDPVAMAEFGAGADTLVVPVPVSFKLAD